MKHILFVMIQMKSLTKFLMVLVMSHIIWICSIVLISVISWGLRIVLMLKWYICRLGHAKYGPKSVNSLKIQVLEGLVLFMVEETIQLKVPIIFNTPGILITMRDVLNIGMNYSLLVQPIFQSSCQNLQSVKNPC